MRKSKKINKPQPEELVTEEKITHEEYDSVANIIAAKEKLENEISANKQEKFRGSFRRINTPPDNTIDNELGPKYIVEAYEKELANRIWCDDKVPQINVQLKIEDYNFLMDYNKKEFDGELSLAQLARIFIKRGIKSLQ